MQESKILEALQHPNIVKFIEVFKTKKGKLCIVMDFADGKAQFFILQAETCKAGLKSKEGDSLVRLRFWSGLLKYVWDLNISMTGKFSTET